MPKMSVISMFANDPSISRRAIDFFNSSDFIAETFRSAGDWRGAPACIYQQAHRLTNEERKTRGTA